MIALCDNNAQRAVVVAIQTFFIPSNLNERQFSGLPLSKDLSLALKKLGIISLGDLNGISQKDFQSVSSQSSTLVVELIELIQKLRTAQLSSDNSSKPVNPDTTNSTQTCLSQKMQPSDAIAIPEEVQGHLLSSFPMSVRLENVLEFKKIQQLGDLHELTYGEIGKYRNCGRKTVDELRALVDQICAGKQMPATDFLDAPVRAGRLSIPTNANELNPFDLPLSARLENVLAQKGIKRLGDLAEISVRELLDTKNCGKKTINELDRILLRARAGEFDLPKKIDARFFAEHVDTFFAQWKTSARNTVALRYGGTTGFSLTLEEIGGKMGVTRERIRQICASTFQKLQRSHGLKMRRLEEELIRINNAEQRPIEWSDIAFQGQTYAYKEKFYCRVLKEVFPKLSVAGIKEWNPYQVLLTYGQEIKELEKKAELALGDYTVDQAHQEYSSRFGHVNLVEFNEMLIQSGRLRIHDRKEKGAVIYPKLLNKLNLLRGMLERATKPLSSRKAYAEFKAVHKAHGYKNYPAFRRIHSLLSETPGIFYFGKSIFGLEKHLHVSPKHWPALVGEFEAHLRQNQKPTSTNEFLDLHRGWGHELTAQELADILRQASNLTDLGRQLFALPEWKLSKREKIVDIIRQALRVASHPVSEEHLIAAVTVRRSAFIQTFTSYLEKIPEMFRYGGGYYGLTPPSEKVYEHLFEEELFFEKVLRRRQPPILVENLWREFGCESTHTPIGRVRDASTAWKTIRLLSRHDGVEVFHTGWSMRRLLAGIIRSTSHPMGRHEVEWEIKERYAAVLVGLNEKRMRELLKHDPLFIENADGNLMCSDSLDKVVPQAEELSERAAEIVANLNRVVPSEDILDRLQAEGFETKEITEDILAMLLRQSPYVKEVGHGWFQPTKN